MIMVKRSVSIIQETKKLAWKQQTKGFLGAIPVCALITICLEVGLAFLHRGGSVRKHLIHFAILLLATEGMVLLYGAVPSVRRIWKRIDRRILSAETRKTWVDIAYIAFATLMVLHHFYVLLYYPALPAGASRFAPVWIPFAVVTVLMGKLWRDKGFWICVLLAAFLFERTYLKEPNLSGETMVYMVSAIYSLIICYGFLSVIQEKHRYGALRALCALWTLGTMVLCGIGLYVAWTGEMVQNLAGTYAYNFYGRLHLFSVATISGGMVAGGAMVALVGFAIARNAVSKILYIVAIFAMLLTNSLTDTRSCFIILSFAIAGVATLGIWGVVKKRIQKGKARNILVAAGLVACAAGCFLISLTAQQRMTKQFVELRDRGGVFVASAQADEPEKVTYFKERDISTEEIENIDDLLSGRITVWETALNYAGSHPETLICGLSADGSVRDVIQRDDHCHNIVIQTFMEGGIIGLGLFLGLLGYFGYCALRLWRRWDLPLWQRALPVPALAVLMMEMVECLTHFAYGHVPMTVLYFFIGATVAVSRGLEGKNREDSSASLRTTG